MNKVPLLKSKRLLVVSVADEGSLFLVMEGILMLKSKFRVIIVPPKPRDMPKLAVFGSSSVGSKYPFIRLDS